MSQTKARLMQDMKEALKAGEKDRLMVIRMLIAEVKNAEINDAQNPGKEKPEADVIATITAYHKSLTKTVAEYPADRQAPLIAELRVIDAYLPKQLSLEEAKAEIQTEFSALTERNFGALMKHFQPKFTGRADGKTISEALKAILSTHKEN